MSFLNHLLPLHTLDERWIKLNQQLNQIPLDIQSYQKSLKANEDELKIAQAAYQKKEIQRQSIDKRLDELASIIIRYKTQQATAKKNEELLALEHQIQSAKTEITQLEEEGLALLETLEADEASYALQKKAINDQKNTTQEQILLLENKYKTLKDDLNTLSIDIENAKSLIPPDLLNRYEKTKKRVTRPPFIVLFKDQRCQGCFVKLSQDCISEIIKTGFENCNQCGRLLYTDV